MVVLKKRMEYINRKYEINSKIKKSNKRYIVSILYDSYRHAIDSWYI